MAKPSGMVRLTSLLSDAPPSVPELEPGRNRRVHCSSRFGTSRLLRVRAPTIKFTVMLMSHITHTARPIKDCLLVHTHPRRPTRDDELLLVTRRMVKAARIAQVGELLSKSRSFLFRVRVEEILQL